ncbi:MAG: glycerol-3-phosphate 1-O-acyltransferase PlsY [Bacteroidales bacterium]|nr:glycerol-3-phosphate 1-O-acyltransferase PlsY [Bacteroidales bacterium]
MFYVFCILSYLIGSIPTAIWWSKKFYNIDIRQHGSKNAGATNVFRVLGAKAALPVFVIDTFKGFILPFLYLQINRTSDSNVIFFSLIIGLFAIVGHLFPIYAKFKGGKGVATSFGVILAVFTLPALLCLLVFVIVFMLFKYVSLASMLSAISFVIFTFVFYDSIYIRGFAIFLALIIICTHKSNIERLVKGTENKITFKKTNS